METLELKALVAERARALTIVLLTERADLRFTEPRTEGAPDFVVQIQTTAKRGIRQFAVFVRAEVPPHTDEEADKALQPDMRRLARAGAYPLPVCLFYFTMQDDIARYTWLAEPHVTADGRARLTIHGAAHCEALDQAALDTIVRQVDRWYDAFYDNLTPRNGSSGD